MAFSLTNHSLLTPRLSACFSSPKPTKTLALCQPLPHHRICKPILGFLSHTNSSPININDKSRRSFKSYLSAQDSAPTANDVEVSSLNDAKTLESEEDQASERDVTSESEGDQRHLSSLETLIKGYKEAILAGDETTLSDVETRIHVIENEKNELVQKVAALSTYVTTGKEKYIRLQADFDNFRKRSEKERLTIRSDAQGEVIETLLPMVDNFERAKLQIKPETEKEKKIDESYQGIYKQFVEIMSNLEVATVPTVGKPFDPLLHEAIAREESQEFEEGIVSEEFRRGFLLGERLLRPAMVKVSSGPGSKKAPVAAEESIEESSTAE